MMEDYVVHENGGGMKHKTAEVPDSVWLHRTAIVGARCKLGDGCELGARCELGDGCKLSTITHLRWNTNYSGVINGVHSVRVGCRIMSFPNMIAYLEDPKYSRSCNPQERVGIVKAIKFIQETQEEMK